MDIRILRELTGGTSPVRFDIKRTHAKIARKLGVDDETVRNRVAKFRKSGFLRGFGLFVNPNLLGLQTRVFCFDADAVSLENGLVKKLSLLPGIVTIIKYFGTLVATVFYHEDEESLRKQLELIATLSNARALFDSEYFLPRCEIALTGIDWRIIREVQQGVERDSAIAESLDISSRTVRRRLDRMLREGAVFTMMQFNPPRLEGALIADLFVLCDPESRGRIDRQIASRLGESLLAPEPAVKECAVYHLCVLNFAKAQEITDWAKGVRGVMGARVEVWQDRTDFFDLSVKLLGKKFSTRSGCSSDFSRGRFTSPLKATA
jgi:DNA-binding Lrp family transcriptional regulator